MPLTPECLDQLGLHCDPFAEELREDFVYSDPLQDSLIDIAQRALTEPDAIVILTGASGSGRSTQLMRLLGMLPEHFELIAFRARENTTYEAVDLTIRHHLSAQANADPSAALTSLLTSRIRSGAVQLIAVDDMHRLDPTVLEQLLQVRQRLLKALGSAPRFLFVGDARLSQMALPSLTSTDEARLVRLHLRALNRDQTRAYLRFRLTAAGHPSPDGLLDAQTVETLHLRSNGLPKYLNALADDWLADLCEAAEKAPPASDAPLGALEALINQASRKLVAQNPDLQAVLGAANPKKKPTKKPVAKLAALPWWQQPWLAPALVAAVLLVILLPLLWQLPGQTTEDRTVTVPIPLPTPQTPPPQVELPLGAGEPDLRNLVLRDQVATVQPEPPPPDAPDPTEEQPAPDTAAPETTAQHEEPAPPVVEPPPPPPAPPPAQTDRDWLLAQPPDHLTIQLVAAESLEAARAHVAGVAIDNHTVRFIPIRANQRDFVVAIVGSFNDAASARQSIAQLPPRFRDGNGHWLRSIRSVQAALR